MTQGSKNGVLAKGLIYRFGDFEVDTANRICARAGHAMPISGKVFDVLAVFVENPGRLLEKNELIDHVWPGEFVEEGNLARNVSTLRKVLGDNERRHRYIQTVPGHGYRFLPDVMVCDQSIRVFAEDNGSRVPPTNECPIDQSAIKDMAPVWSEVPVFAQMSRRPLFMSVAAFCLVGAVLLAFRFESYRPLDRDLLSFDRIHKDRLTQEGDVYEPTISPDGQYLAYVKINRNERTLCLRQVATGSTLDLVPLPYPASVWSIAFAPDDKFLYYILKESDLDYGNVYRVPMLGNQPPYKLIEHANGGLTVSPDGRQLAFTRIDRKAGTSSIIVIDRNGDNERSVSSSELDSMYYSLDWSPDGTSFAYSFRRHDSDREYFYLAEIPASGGPETRIGQPSNTAITQVKWLPDKSGLIVNAVDESSGQRQIYNVSYPDGERRRVTNDLNSYIGFSSTADGRSIVIPQINSNRQIWHSSVGGGQNVSQVLGGVERHFDNVAWAGDQFIVFDEDANSSFEGLNIFRARSDGSDLVQLTSGPGNNSAPTVSPDGRSIVFVSDRTGKNQLWRMNIDGHDAEQLTDISNTVIRPVYSPDGQYVYFSVSDAGQCHIWRIPAGGGAPSPVVKADVYRWALAPDGSRIAYSRYDEGTHAVLTYIRSIEGDAEEQALNISPETWMEWSADGRSLLYNTASDGAHNVWRQSLDGSMPEPVTDFSDEQVFRFASSSDGQNLVCIRHTTTFDAIQLRFN